MKDDHFQDVTVGGFRGRFAAFGPPTGSPILILASPLVRGTTYLATAQELARFRRTIILELPGSGKSSRLDPPWDLQVYADWVAGCIDSLNLDDLTVIGHSHSGGIALLLPVRHPGKVARLVISGGIGIGRPISLARGLFARLLDVLTVECRLAARYWHHVVYDAIAHPRNFFRQVHISLKSNLLPVAPQVDVPVLLAWGARDHTIPPDRAKLLATHLPRATLYESPGGSHAWIVSHAAEFAALLEGWLDEGDSSPANMGVSSLAVSSPVREAALRP